MKHMKLAKSRAILCISSCCLLQLTKVEPCAHLLMNFAAVHKSRAMLCISGSGSLLQICKIRSIHDWVLDRFWTQSIPFLNLHCKWISIAFDGSLCTSVLYIQTRTFVQMNSDKDHWHCMLQMSEYVSNGCQVASIYWQMLYMTCCLETLMSAHRVVVFIRLKNKRNCQHITVWQAHYCLLACSHNSWPHSWFLRFLQLHHLPGFVCYPEALLCITQH
jgi:hypothetical protein